MRRHPLPSSSWTTTLARVQFGLEGRDLSRQAYSCQQRFAGCWLPRHLVCSRTHIRSHPLYSAAVVEIGVIRLGHHLGAVRIGGLSAFGWVAMCLSLKY